MLIELQILCDSRNDRMRGIDIIAKQIQTERNALNQSDFVNFFKSSNLLLEKCKEKIGGETLFIFCMNTFSTPNFDDDDRCVLYYCWSDVFQNWYSTHWRISDIWDVTVATLVNSD